MWGEIIEKLDEAEQHPEALDVGEDSFDDGDDDPFDPTEFIDEDDGVLTSVSTGATEGDQNRSLCSRCGRGTPAAPAEEPCGSRSATPPPQHCRHTPTGRPDESAGADDRSLASTGLYRRITAAYVRREWLRRKRWITRFPTFR